MQAAAQALQMRQPKQALTLIDQVLAQVPQSVTAWLIRSRAHRALGQLPQASNDCRQALGIDPDAVPALTEQALIQRHAGQLHEAEQTYRHALTRAPDNALLHHNLANLLQRRQALAEAEAHYRRALALAPQLAEAHTELGRLLQATGQPVQALQCYAAALQVRPDFTPAWELLWAAQAQGHPVDALHALHKDVNGRAASAHQLVLMAQAALRLDPDNLLGHYTLGVAQTQLGESDKALSSLQRVVDEAHQHEVVIQALYMQTRCHMHLGQISRAGQVARAMLDRSANDDERSRAWLLLAATHIEAGRVADALAIYRRAQEIAPPDLHLPMGISLCACSNYDPAIGAQQQLEQARTQLAPLNQPSQWPPLANAPDPERPLRVGYISGDLRLHSCAYFLLPLLARHNPHQFTVYAYNTNAHEDHVTAKLKSHVAHWRQVAQMDDETLIDQIQQDSIDILVDLSGLTDGHRAAALARKPAPLIINWLGYLGTTGISAIDYRLTDPWIDGDGAEALATEKPLRLNRPYLCYVPADVAPAQVGPLPMLSNGYPTFGSFNARTKLSDACLALWCEVLQAIPQARLLIKSKAWADAPLRDALLAQVAQHGIDPQRVELRAWEHSTANHLEAYNEVDVCLDSFPYNGVTTTCEASWMGVPVVSLVGETFASRQGLSLLTAMGLPDHAAHTTQAFVTRCQALVADSAALAALRMGMRERMGSSALMNTHDFARQVESRYRQAWRGWCQQQTS